MRLIKNIPHSKYLIEIHEYNNKYILKITLDNYEQVYKIPVQNISSLTKIDEIVSEEFLSNNLKRFLAMKEDWVKNIYH